MSKDSSDLQRPKDSLSRRRFMQNTALLTGLSVGGTQLAEPLPLEARERVANLKVAQAAPVAGAAPAAPIENAPQIALEPPISLQEFIHLSQVLTGFDSLEPDLAAQYLQRCADNPEVSGQLKTLVQTLSSLKGSRRDLENQFRDKMVAAGVDSPFFAASEQVIYLWYVGGFFKKGPTGARSWDYGLPQHYFRGKVWSVIGVKPPMTAHTSTTFWTRPGTNGA